MRIIPALVRQLKAQLFRVLILSVLVYFGFKRLEFKPIVPHPGRIEKFQSKTAQLGLHPVLGKALGASLPKNRKLSRKKEWDDGTVVYEVEGTQITVLPDGEMLVLPRAL